MKKEDLESAVFEARRFIAAAEALPVDDYTGHGVSEKAAKLMARSKKAAIVKRERIILAQPANWRQHADALRSNRGRPTPRVLRRGDGVDNRMDRLKAIGNGVDVDVAEWIGRRIMESAGAEGVR